MKGNKYGNQDMPLKNRRGEVVSDRDEKIEIIKEHYRKLADYIYSEDPYGEIIVINNENHSISYKELRRTALKCANNKACGPDKIPSEVWKAVIKESPEDAPRVAGVLHNKMNEAIRG
jgi:hypothetical protein